MAQSTIRCIRCSLFIALLAVSVACQNANNTATVNLGDRTGNPKNLASGFIYGMPDAGFGQSPDQIPECFYQNIGFRYGRAGGAQLTEGGWIDGTAAYEARFHSTQQDYLTARANGARFQILPHDVWGTDHANSSTVWPGDDGDWSNYDEFLDTLLTDLQTTDMLDGLDWDLWNEPDGGYFWIRSQEQYLEMWLRTYQNIRSRSAFDDVLIVGPSSAGQPSTSNSWWVEWLEYIVANNVVPDQYTWHDEPGDPGVDIPNLYTLLDVHGAPEKTININEYATYAQQVAAGAAWFISRLERYNAYGLRGNWLSACQLHDFMASLVGKTDDDNCTGAGYYPNGEYQVYQYYHLNMTGERAATTGSGDGFLDAYTTIQSSTVTTLVGVLDNTGTWYLTFDDLSAVGLPTAGNLTVQTWGFIDNGHFGKVTAGTNRGTYAHTYSGNILTFPIYQTSVDEFTAWVFEFSIP